MDRFELQGFSYYQQGRKCGKVACRQCANGHAHGPYWYRRNLETGKVEYLGKDLPASVFTARDALKTLAAQIKQNARDLDNSILRLVNQRDALVRLHNGYALKPSDVQVVKQFGFDSCLV